MRWLAALLLLAPLGAEARKLDRAERQTARWLEANEAEGLALLEDLVAINSGTGNHAGVREVGAVVEERLAAIGFETRWEDSPERAGHLVAVRRGDRGSRVLLIGHLDTVFEADSPFQGFERRPDGTASGPGIEDDKGGVVVIVRALEALAAAGALEGTTITVYLTGDEEKPGADLEAARAGLVAAAKESDLALGFEPGVLDNPGLAVAARRGFSAWDLAVTADGGHSSRVGAEGYGWGAIYELSRVLSALQAEVPEEHLTLNTGLITGGTEAALDPEAAWGEASGKRNVIPSSAHAYGDLRFLSDAQKDRARARMEAIAAESLDGATATFTFEDGYPAMAPTEGNLALLAELDEVSRDLGQGPVEAMDPGLRGAADVSFVAPYVPCLDGLGLRGHGAHAPGEIADLTSLTPTSQRAAVLIYRLTR
jgi:glutamate carboxypeptidase